jgi:hypothetical protein
MFDMGGGGNAPDFSFLNALNVKQNFGEMANAQNQKLQWLGDMAKQNQLDDQNSLAQEQLINDKEALVNKALPDFLKRDFNAVKDREKSLRKELDDAQAASGYDNTKFFTSHAGKLAAQKYIWGLQNMDELNTGLQNLENVRSWRKAAMEGLPDAPTNDYTDYGSHVQDYEGGKIDKLLPYGGAMKLTNVDLQPDYQKQRSATNRFAPEDIKLEQAQSDWLLRTGAYKYLNKIQDPAKRQEFLQRVLEPINTRYQSGAPFQKGFDDPSTKDFHNAMAGIAQQNVDIRKAIEQAKDQANIAHFGDVEPAVITFNKQVGKDETSDHDVNGFAMALPESKVVSIATNDSKTPNLITRDKNHAGNMVNTEHGYAHKTITHSLDGVKIQRVVAMPAAEPSELEKGQGLDKMRLYVEVSHPQTHQVTYVPLNNAASAISSAYAKQGLDVNKIRQEFYNRYGTDKMQYDIDVNQASQGTLQVAAPTNTNKVVGTGKASNGTVYTITKD